MENERGNIRSQSIKYKKLQTLMLTFTDVSYQ